MMAQKSYVYLPGTFMAKKNDGQWYLLRALNQLLKSSIMDHFGEVESFVVAMDVAIKIFTF